MHGSTPLAAAAVALVAGAAQAQQPVNTLDGYDSGVAGLGIQAGSFTIYPQIEVKPEYNSNIYQVQSNRVDDFIFRIPARIDFRSNFDRHQLNLAVGGEVGLYAQETDQNYYDAFAIADGRLDAWTGGSLFGLVALRREHEDRGSISGRGNLEPIPYYYSTFNGGAQHDFGMAAAYTGVRVDRYTYEDSDRPPGYSSSNSYRDRWQYQPYAGIYYRYTDQSQPFMRGSLNWRDYDDTTDPEGFKKSSKGGDFVVGWRYVSGGLDAEFFGGFLSQNYDDNRFSTTTTWKAGAKISFSQPAPRFNEFPQPDPKFAVSITADRTIEETTLTGSSGALVTYVAGEVTYQISPGLLIRPKVLVAQIDYQTASSVPGVVEETDYLIQAGIGLKYRLSPYFYVGPEYNFQQRNSNVQGNDFNQHIVSLRFGARR